MERNNLLVAKRGAGIKTSGNLYDDYGKTTLKEGELGIYDPKTFNFLGAAPIDPELYPEIGIAAGYRQYDERTQKSWLTARLAAGDTIEVLNIQNGSAGFDSVMKAQVPTCGSDHVIDALVDCVSENGTYGISVVVYDERSGQRFGNSNYGEKYDFFVSSEEVDECIECQTFDNVHERVLCALVNKINTGSVTGTHYPGMWGTDRSTERQMFHAVKLQTYSSTYTFGTADSGDCVVCNAVAGWKSFTADGKTIDLTPFLDANGYFPVDDMHLVVDAINKSDLGVYASLRSTGQNCCGHVIDVMHCTDDLSYVDKDDETITVDATTPLANQCTKIEICKDCNPPEDTTTALPGGIRLYFNPQGYEMTRCGLPIWPDVDVRIGQVIMSDKGYNGFKKWCVKEIAIPNQPMNQGYQWYEMEMNTANGGKGRGHGLGFGSVKRIEDYSKYLGMAVDAKENYCSFDIPYYKTFKDDFQVEAARAVELNTTILFPIGDVVTIEAFQDIWNAYTNNVPMRNYPELLCYVDGAVAGADVLDQDAGIVVSDVEVDLTAAEATTVGGLFRAINCDPVSYVISDEVNCSVTSNGDGTFEVTPAVAGAYSVKITASCDEISAEATISGTAS